MDFNELKEFVKLVDSSKFKEIQLCMDNVEIRLSEKTNTEKEKVFEKSDLKEFEKITINENVKSVFMEDTSEKTFDKDDKLVKSPIVGCFYESPSPEQKPFVAIGDKVKKGDILCVIEAMKVMNEITSPYDGEIKEILVSNEDMVEFDQPIFVIV